MDLKTEKILQMYSIFSTRLASNSIEMKDSLSHLELYLNSIEGENEQIDVTCAFAAANNFNGKFKICFSFHYSQ